MTALLRWLEEAKRRGLIGPEPLERTVEHAQGLGRVAMEAGVPGGACLDLGSGGGVPGLILALEWPDSEWTLLDSNLRSGEFLLKAVEALELGERVGVVVERAEVAGRDPARRGRYALVTARSVGPAAVTAEYVAPLLAEAGLAVVSEPPDSAGRWDDEGLAGLGLRLESRTAEPVAAALLRQESTVPDRYPRRVGVAVKRPRWK